MNILSSFIHQHEWVGCKCILCGKINHNLHELDSFCCCKFCNERFHKWKEIAVHKLEIHRYCIRCGEEDIVPLESDNNYSVEDKLLNKD